MIRKEQDKRIQTARKSIKSARYGEALAFLESINAGDSHSPALLFFHAYAAVMAGNIPQALSSAERLRTRYSSYNPGKELNAFLKFKSAPEKDHAAAVYIELLSEGVDSPNVKSVLKKIRNCGNFPDLQRSSRLVDFLPIKSVVIGHEQDPDDRYFNPKERIRPIKRRAFPVKLALLSAAAAVLFFLLIYVLLFTSIPSSIIRQADTDITPVDKADISNERYPFIQKDAGDTLFKYSDESALRNDYENGRNLLKNGSSEDALIIFNRIINSNAQYMLRERARFLIDYISGLDERTPKVISPNELVQQPLLYKGIFVKFSSSVITVKIKEKTAVISSVYHGKGNPSVNFDIFAKENVKAAKGDEIICSGIFSQIIGRDNRLIIESRSIEKQQ